MAQDEFTFRKAMPIPLTAYEVGHLPPPAIIFGQSEVMIPVRDAVTKVAATSLPVLIVGESGTGKEVIAKFIHHASPRMNTPFVKVSCPTLRTPLEVSERRGIGGNPQTQETCTMRVDLSNGGTLFFDEVGELATPMQGQLVILLQPGFAGSGAQNEDENAQTRIMCSTSHLKLEEEAEAGGFRQDLYYYISVVCIRMPPLRERCADIPLILNYLLESYSDLYRRPRVPVPSEILSLAQAHAWPGNILQLENFVKRFVILGPENPLLKEMLRPSSGANEMFSARG